MEAAAASSSLWELVVFLFSVGLPGLPPGPHDPALLRAAPTEAWVAIEWSGRSAGTAGAPGIEGLAADPEIRRGLQAVHALRRQLQASEHHHEGLTARVLQQLPDLCDVLFAQPGCLFVAPTGSGAAPLSLATCQVGLVLNAGDRAEALQERLPPWALIPAAEDQPAPRRLALPGIEFRRVGPYFVWNFGVGSAAATAERLQSPDAGLAASPRFQQALRRVAVERPASLVWLHPQLAQQVLTLTGMDQAETIQPVRHLLDREHGVQLLSVCGTDGGRVVSRTLIGGFAQGDRDAPQRLGISEAALARIPADAHLVAALHCDLGQLLQPLFEGVQKLKPRHARQLDDLAHRLEERLGLKWRDDVIPALGADWTVYSAPSTGGAYGVAPVFSLEVRNAAQVDALVSRLMRVVEEANRTDDPNGFRVERETLFDHEIVTFHSPETRRLGMAPSVCLTRQQLLCALHPQALRAHLRFLSGAGPNFAQRLGRDVVLPPGAVAWCYVDSPRFAELTLPGLPYAIRQQAGARHDELLAALPSAAAVLPYLAPTTASIAIVPEGVLCEMRNPLSLATPLLAVATVAGMIHSQSAAAPATTETPASPGVSIELGDPEGGPATLPAAPVPSLPKEALPADEQNEKQPEASAARRWGAAMLRAFAPPEVQFLIPDEVYRRMEEGPTPEQQRLREERRQARERRRHSRP